MKNRSIYELNHLPPEERTKVYRALIPPSLFASLEIDRNTLLNRRGEKAVQFSAMEDASGSVAIRRIGDYAVEYFLTPLETVARNTKPMPDEFIDVQNSTVTGTFAAYARPLIGTIPACERISAPAVAKILKKA